jgi:sensor domain CHASE-containing protein
MTTSEQDKIPYTRTPNVVHRKMDDSIFLADQNVDSVFHLNQTGAAIWHLLEQPTTMEEIITTLNAAFPAISCDEIEKDVRKVFRQLSGKGLIQPQSSQ